MCSYRDERRAEFVARRLTETNESLSAIAHDAGYADQSHMTSTFASLSGMTPAKFRDLFRR
jgi:AraC-like DNA-binding protein